MQTETGSSSARRPHRVDSLILAAFLLASLAAMAAALILSHLALGDMFAFDKWLILALRSPADAAMPAGPGWLTKTMVDVTALGGRPVLTMVTVIAAGYMLVTRKAATAGFLIVATSIGVAAGILLKLLFARARPDIVEHLVSVESASFPSAHALNSAVTYLTLGALLARGETQRSVQVYMLAVAILLTLLVGFSRVYLGVHWPSDVFAGWAAGAAWALLCWAAARALQRRDRIEPATHQEPPSSA